MEKSISAFTNHVKSYRELDLKIKIFFISCEQGILSFLKKYENSRINYPLHDFFEA